MNCTQQIGRLTAEPDPLKSTEHGVVTTFRIAVPRPIASALAASALMGTEMRRATSRASAAAVPIATSSPRISSSAAGCAPASSAEAGTPIETAQPVACERR